MFAWCQAIDIRPEFRLFGVSVVSAVVLIPSVLLLVAVGAVLRGLPGLPMFIK